AAPLSFPRPVLQTGQPAIAWSDLVLPAPLLLQLQTLALTLSPGLAAPPATALVPVPNGSPDLPNAAPGTIALFAGPPGTGKLTAAAAIAHHLNHSLTWIDLATVHPDAYSDLLAAIADQAPAILCLRSAQVWFGPRALIAPTALAAFCQCRRQFPSVTLLSVPQRSAVRLQWQSQCDRILTFPLPDALARQHLWQQAFAATLPAIATLDWHALAQIPSLSGGEIQQIVQLAARLATVTEASAVDPDHLTIALEQWRQQLPLIEVHARHLDRLDWRTVVTHLPTPRKPPRSKQTPPVRTPRTRTPKPKRSSP
ncbi:hypothetical protein, partial [Trichothermofontia sp.]